jgi:hypothetical protein
MPLLSGPSECPCRRSRPLQSSDGKVKETRPKTLMYINTAFITKTFTTFQPKKHAGVH